jgi:hypothetical protein
LGAADIEDAWAKAQKGKSEDEKKKLITDALLTLLDELREKDP